MLEVNDRHITLPLLLSLPVFVLLSLLFPLLSAVDKLLALASVSLLLRISKLEPYL